MENKSGKYLKYAIGEIVLVVIGILIALQINNWNEWRKDRVKEHFILKDLAKNIQINIQTFQDDIDKLQLWNRSSDIIIRALENKQEFSDTLKQHFHLARVTKQDLFLSNIGYQAYKNQGLDIILNKPLSEEIIKLYEVTISSALSTNSLVNGDYPELDNHIVQNFDLMILKGKEGELTPKDYKSLFNDQFYMSWIKAYMQGRIGLIETDKKLIKECERVLDLVNKELNLKTS